MTERLALAAVALAALAPLYAYVLYPALLLVIGGRRRVAHSPSEPERWPPVSISLPVFNEEREVRGALDAILALDYPPELRQVVVVSDASTDGTDGVVRSYADRGVQLLRLAERGGKTAAENAAAKHLTGDVVVNTDASIRILPGSLKALIRALDDPGVGVASGRDVSVTRVGADGNPGEHGYVGYEMWVRRLETRAGGIVGASGCFYAIRAHLHRLPLPEGLSRDFASALLSRRAGYRAVSVDDGVCLVPRVAAAQREYRRKVRTIARGMQTLWFLREVADPLRYRGFAWRLLSHKVARWLVPWTTLGGAMGAAVLAGGRGWTVAAAGAALGMGVLGIVGVMWPGERSLPRLLAIPAFALAGNAAALHASLRALRGVSGAVWEPTRREQVN